MIIGRKQEQSDLLRLIEEPESQFCAVYGRRRIGKTFLIRETFAHRFAFQHTGLAKAAKKEQLAEFKESLRAAGMRANKSPKDWYEAFHMLADYLATLPAGKKIIFLDELSWMDTPKSGFMSALEHFWNGWAAARAEKDIVLVVCGSATSWIINKVIKNRGGLHNRLTMRIHLKPFTLKECEEYAQSRNLPLSRQDIAETYMMLGGVPYYWSFLRKNESLAQNIDRMIFAEDAPLAEEHQALYASLFDHPEPYIAIVEALTRKKCGLTRNELLNATKLSDNTTFTRTLNELEQCNFIRKYYCFGKKERESTYQMIDNFTLFHFQYIIGNVRHDPHFWSHSIGTPIHHTWSGLAFERLCLWHLPQINSALGITGVISSAHSWRTTANEDHEGAQIDLLIDRNDNVINLCEMKYCDEKYTFTKEEADKLQQRRSVFKKVTRTRKTIHTTLVTMHGIAHNKYTNDIHSEICINDLFA